MDEEVVIEIGPDGGPIYTETNLEAFVAEPFNAVTAFFFLMIAVYWLFKLRKTYRVHLFLFVSSLILLVGGLGGTIYHAFRVSKFALLMDWLPIVILCFSASVYFLVKLFGKLYFGVLAFIVFMLLEFLNHWLMPPHYAVNISYVLMALMVLIPIMLYLIRTNWRNGIWILIAFTGFLFAIINRSIDHLEVLAIGTHFLWHIFGAIACHAMFQYLYKMEKINVV